jgi:fused signal recognition particle receptor
MIAIFKKKPQMSSVEKEQAPQNILQRLKHSLIKTRQQLKENLASLVLGKKEIDADLLKDIEVRLLQADVGIQVTQELIQFLTQKLNREALKDGQSLLVALRQQLIDILTVPTVKIPSSSPQVILMVGVNGTGKTTTIGKLAHFYQQENKTVMLAAGDTFRAAAIEQLQIWGERNHCPVISQHSGADSASVLFDAFSAARARNIDILLADTAGRLHTKTNLIEELKKIKRVLGKLDEQAPHETLLVLDAGIGQNALIQAEQFHAAIGLTGLVITKLDGTAKGGIVFAIARKLGLPIKFLGMGEKIEDLIPFNPEEFVTALFEE